MNNYDDFIILIKRDPKVQIKMRDILDKNTRLPDNYQSKKGHDTLIQNFILKEIINLLGTTILDIDTELKMKISNIEYLGSRIIYNNHKYSYMKNKYNCMCYR